MKITKENHQRCASEKDELRGRFTVWVELVCKTTRINYLKRRQRELQYVSWEELSEERHPYTTDEPTYMSQLNGFLFESPIMERAYGKLPPIKRQILKWIYADNLSFEEIAARMGCSVGNVYNHHSAALKKMREEMSKERNHE